MPALARLTAATAFSLCVFALPAGAAAIDINGGASWAGWTAAGTAQNASSYVQGSATRNYQMYRADFTLDATQTLGSSANVGDNAASLFSGSWQAGDQILGLGLSYGGGQSGISFFFHLDMAGDSIQSASELGGAVGNYSANAGDTSAYFTGGASGSNKFRNQTYAVFNAYTPDGSNNFTVPYGAGGNLNAPGRGFAILAPSSTSSVSSAQFFFNLSAMAAPAAPACSRSRCLPTPRPSPCRPPRHCCWGRWPSCCGSGQAARCSRRPEPLVLIAFSQAPRHAAGGEAPWPPLKRR